MAISLDLRASYLERLSKLFHSRTQDSLILSFKEVTEKSSYFNEVLKVYAEAGFKERVCSVVQPTRSAEINSQNFIVLNESKQDVVLRRCVRFTGKARFESLNKLFDQLKQDGVRVPELYTLEKRVIYLEKSSDNGRIGWVFFKYIHAPKFFSGSAGELTNASEQVGRMHASLKRRYGHVMAISENAGQADSSPGPYLSRDKWHFYIKLIEARAPNLDVYDKEFCDNKTLIEEMVEFVETNYKLLEEENDIQNIHFDLNATNFLSDGENITLMDFDDVRLGNVYTDIGFAIHRLIAACIELGHTDVGALIHRFLEGYRKGNPDLQLNIQKLTVATYNRALRNVGANLHLKYDLNSSDWLGSISVNIQRLKQIQLLMTYLL